MMFRNVVDALHRDVGCGWCYACVRCVGDSLNGLTDAIRKSEAIEWLHVRHEEVAAFAAGADAQVTGRLGVCAGSCGPGNLHLINGLYDCHRNRVPVLAIAAQVPSGRSEAAISRRPILNICSRTAVTTANWSLRPNKCRACSASRCERRSRSAAWRS